MRNKVRNYLLIGVAFFILAGCEESDNNAQKQIVYRSVDKEYVVLRDIQTLQASDDEISNHIDSILNGLINTELISTGQKELNLDSDLIPEIAFEIIDLNKYNPNGLPESLDSLAVRVLPMFVEILDNSTFGYADALNSNEVIDEKGNWTQKTCVLGTFENAGNFQGQGEKFLAYRFSSATEYKYGWIRIYCSQHNDTLRIIDYAYNDILNSQIFAGQVK